MSTQLNSFIDIFDTEIEYQSENVSLKKIVIPMIQRDFAQGRREPETDRVRKRFLESLYQAVSQTPITLDFVYGDIDESGVMTPLDGQQRLTTLFLLHWYAAKKDGIDSSEYEFLNCFSYETRYSARNFCASLISFQPSFTTTISEEIIDQSWFPLDWLKDPTVSSMLVMIDAINEKFAGISDLWEKLKNKSISFYFLPVKNMGLTDELYIKMNSRGKPLTQFENFKAELEHNLKEIDSDVAKRILQKIDINWTNMLWDYRGNDNIIDDEFLRYYRFVCDVLCYRSGGSPQGISSDEFDLMREYFSVESESVLENVRVLEELFDCWSCTGEDSPSSFLDKYFSHKHVTGKIQIEDRYQIDIFKDCLQNYADIGGGKNRKFPLNRIVLLYSIVFYLLHKDSITEPEFVRRLRIINNLVQNSQDEISDSESRNRMPAILSQVESIMGKGLFDNSINNSFNQFQIEEETNKLRWCVINQDAVVEALFELEDHPLLYGQISIIGLDHSEYFHRFKSLFMCNRDAIDCALLATEDYVQTDRNGWRHQMGSRSDKIDVAWKNLFHKSANNGYDKTHDAICQLLAKAEVFSDELLEEIAKAYLTDCETKKEYDWKYYYIKYESFRLRRYGKYCWPDYDNKPYEMLALWAKYYWSSNAYQPFLYAIDESRIDQHHNRERLSYGNKYVVCENSAYVIYNIESDEELARINISQNETGIDIEDRILKGQRELSAYTGENGPPDR